LVAVLEKLKLTWSVPKNDFRTAAAAPFWHMCAAGYSGWFGVGTTGVQVASAVVAALPSVSASGIALCGRQ